MSFQTENAFTLPKGYVDNNGTLHREGIMRLATAADEILPMRDPRVQQNPQYLSVILFSRVITNLGSLPEVNTKIIEKLFSCDLSFLQEMYNRINQAEAIKYETVCPKCKEKISVPLKFTEH